MKQVSNFAKVLVSVLMVLCVSMFVACSKDDDNKGGGGGGGKIDSAIRGTWVGDEDNGTLVISASDMTSESDYSTGAGQVSLTIGMYINGYDLGGAKYEITKISGGEIMLKLSAGGQSAESVLYTYKVENNVLTIKNANGSTVFVGTKK
jgi:hypothetical protein